MTSVGVELPRQIERVAGLRERYRAAAREAEHRGIGDAAAYEPAIVLMTRDLDAAQAAIAAGDAVGCVRTYKALKGYADA